MTIACFAALGGMALVASAQVGGTTVASTPIVHGGLPVACSSVQAGRDTLQIGIMTRVKAPSAASVGLAVLVLATRRSRR